MIGETEGFKQKFTKTSVELADLQRERENYKISKEESLKELNNSL